MSGATAGYPGGYPRGPNPGVGIGPGLWDTPRRDTPCARSPLRDPGVQPPRTRAPRVHRRLGSAPVGYLGASHVVLPALDPGVERAEGRRAGPRRGTTAPSAPGVPHQGPGGTRPSPRVPRPPPPGPLEGVPMRGPPPEPASAGGTRPARSRGTAVPGTSPGTAVRRVSGCCRTARSGTSAPRRPPSATVAICSAGAPLVRRRAPLRAQRALDARS